MKLVLYSLVRSENVHALMNVTEEGEGGGGGGESYDEDDGLAQQYSNGPGLWWERLQRWWQDTV